MSSVRDTSIPISTQDRTSIKSIHEAVVGYAYPLISFHEYMLLSLLHERSDRKTGSLKAQKIHIRVCKSKDESSRVEIHGK
jgi:hypothetical protein